MKTRRALSSIVTSAILLTATVLTGSGLVNWSNSSLSSYETALSNTFSTNVNKLSENLSIENVWFGTSPSKFLNVTTTNTGTIGVNVTKISLKTSTTTTDILFTHSGIVPQKQNSTKIIYDWQSGNPIQITITTARGTIFTTQVMPP
ncbi:MAG TPA: hypothetical protein VI146_07210 [Nitrososphaeraceae archaeon]